MKTVFALLCLALSLLSAPALADNAVVLPNGCDPATLYNSGVQQTTQNKNGELCVRASGTVTATVAATAAAALPTLSAGAAALYESLSGGLYVQPIQGTGILSITNGGYQNLLQGNAALSATNGLYSNFLQGNVALSTTNGLYSNLLQGNAALSATNGIFSNQVIAGAVLSATNGTYANLLQGNAVLSATNPLPVASTPGARTLVTLDVKTVTTGGTAVTALTSGHKSAGGWIQNPPSATINLCINEIGTATGTTSSGDTTCIIPGQTYNLVPSSGAVSVISSDSSHPFSGYGFQ